MRFVIFSPPLRHVSGGLASLWELAEMLARRGVSVAFAGPDADAEFAVLPEHPASPANITRLNWDARGAFLNADDVWLVPEGWPNAIAPGLAAGAHVLVYVQNWFFMLSGLPEGVDWKKLTRRAPDGHLRFLAVSEPVRHFMTNILGLEKRHVLQNILPPAAHSCFFRQNNQSESVRVGWMPRKNRALAEQIRLIFQALPGVEGRKKPVEFVPIHHQDREGVARLLASCNIFLCTGFPEGFALPPLEAMACGCVPVGFAGLGGFEYMRNPDPLPLSCLHTPPLPLAPKPWGGNGFFVADGDTLGAAVCLAHAVGLARSGNGLWRELIANGRRTALAYSRRAREERLETVLAEISDLTFQCQDNRR